MNKREGKSLNEQDAHWQARESLPAESSQTEHGIATYDLYKNPATPEQSRLNDTYRHIQRLYYIVMFEAPTDWCGYDSGLGFDIPADTFQVAYPSLQKVLSRLHVDMSINKIGSEELKKKLAIVVDALNRFDPEQDVDERRRESFYQSGARAYIDKVKSELQSELEIL